MESMHWSTLLRKIPPEVHNQLSVNTVSGTEVIVQAFLGLEGECLAVKGRLAASQDAGRLYFIPFDQIDYIGFTRTVGEDEYRAWFGAPAAAPAASSTSDTVSDAPQSSTSGKTPTPNRAALLERIRARTTSPGI